MFRSTQNTIKQQFYDVGEKTQILANFQNLKNTEKKVKDFEVWGYVFQNLAATCTESLRRGPLFLLGPLP